MLSYNNLSVSEKHCPACSAGQKEIWQSSQQMLQCCRCGWWGWLRPDLVKRREKEKDKTDVILSRQ